jgi:D-cysteine desulfhydrase
MKRFSELIPLFEQFPCLKEKIPFVSLGEYPTPIERLGRTQRILGIGQLLVKRDDLSGKVYGGNKIRKLEFILGQALKKNAKGVFAFGAAGSNHALATAIYAKQLGLKSISMLIRQPNAEYVRKNLLLSHHYGAELHQYRNLRALYFGTFYQFLLHKLRYGYFPFFIPVGGSCPMGIVGYVNAIFELKKQIIQKKLPEPDCIYVASGTMGTAVGLLIGIKATKLKSRVVSVRVTGEEFAGEKKMMKLIHKTISFLHTKDSSFPLLEFSEEDIVIKHDFIGGGYAQFTTKGMDAISLIQRNEGLKLDGTYTGKAFAALVDDAKKGYLKDKIVLFWNTYNSRDFSDILTKIDYDQLPQCFHEYFEEDVQPLDKQFSS